jgi:CheY-like chemotaxis protein
MICPRHPAGEPPALSEAAVGPRAAGRRLRVLVIEDDPQAADVLQTFLECQGHEAAVARSGPEGVSLARTWRPDVVLADIGLPGMDGWAVAQRLRRLPGTSRSRLIALTGRTDEGDDRRSREAGFHFHLTKPCDPALLGQLLNGHSG